MKLKRIGNAFHCGLFSFYPSLVRFGFMQFMASAKVLRPTVSPLIYARGMEVWEGGGGYASRGCVCDTLPAAT